MNIPNNLGKSCLLAAGIFWIIIGSEDFDSNMILFIFLSLIPIFLFVTVVVLFTICPFFWWKENSKFNKQQVFKTYFPYYAIIAFGSCAFGIISSDFDVYMIAFFASAFITTNQSWIWFAKEQKHEKA